MQYGLRVVASFAGLAWILIAGWASAQNVPPPDVKDVPEVRYAPRHPQRRTPLERTQDLLLMATRGEGRFSGGGPGLDSLRPRSGLVLTPTAWRIDAEAARRVRLLRFWVPTNTDDEMVVTLVLSPGESWCSAERELGPGARLRLEPFSIEEAGTGRLELLQRRGGRDSRLKQDPAPAFSVLEARAQWDVALDAGRSSVCFTARDHAVAVGKPRILEPRDAADDTRPRWIVLTIFDALRADVLTAKDAAAVCPTLLELSQRGTRFDGAISPGCHTRPAVASILTGRDSMRVDPLLRAFFQVTAGAQAPAAALYARGNLQLGELAESAGYLSVFLGNNRFLTGSEAFARTSIQGAIARGTIDTIARLPALFDRHADERVLLVYYLSTPHGVSSTPRRLYEAFSCGAMSGVEAARCAYRARVRHADEALGALLAGLEDYGLGATTLHFLTADHGERFLDGEPKLFVRTGQYYGRTDETHGTGCGTNEVRVPLVVSGKDVPAGVVATPVSTLDVVPTALRVLGVPPVSRLDGEPLPIAGSGATRAVRDFVSYGFCVDSLKSGPRQLLRWRPDCTIEELDGRRLSYVSELWEGERRLGTDRSAPHLLAPGLARLRGWIASRVPRQALILDASRLSLRVTVRALEGRIADFGPSGTPDVAGIDQVRGDPDERSVTIALAGYRGLFFVATDPPDAPVSVEAHAASSGSPVPLYLGPLQLPLDVAGRPLDPRRDRALLSARAEPGPASGPGLRLWWQPYRPPEEAASRPVLDEINRVLREWGYVR